MINGANPRVEGLETAWAIESRHELPYADALILAAAQQQECRFVASDRWAHGRQIESSEDTAKLDALEKAGKLKRVVFTDRAEMKKLVDPVMASYAKEIGADAIFTQINAIK